jgi:hypothetical protein
MPMIKLSRVDGAFKALGGDCAIQCATAQILKVKYSSKLLYLHTLRSMRNVHLYIGSAHCALSGFKGGGNVS